MTFCFKLDFLGFCLEFNGSQVSLKQCLGPLSSQGPSGPGNMPRLPHTCSADSRVGVAGPAGDEWDSERAPLGGFLVLCEIFTLFTMLLLLLFIKFLHLLVCHHLSVCFSTYLPTFLPTHLSYMSICVS